MMHNFTKSSGITAKLCRSDSAKPSLSSITQYNRVFYFSHLITPAQARDLAADLLALADEAEGKGKTV